MSYAFEDLKGKTVAQLREIASKIEHEAVQGYTQLNKDHLLTAICKALKIDMHAHHEVMGINKKDLKSRIKDLKKVRDDVIEAHDHKRLKEVRRRLHSLKRAITKATV